MAGYAESPQRHNGIWTREWENHVKGDASCVSADDGSERGIVPRPGTSCPRYIVVFFFRTMDIMFSKAEQVHVVMRATRSHRIASLSEEDSQARGVKLTRIGLWGKAASGTTYLVHDPLIFPMVGQLPDDTLRRERPSAINSVGEKKRGGFSRKGRLEPDIYRKRCKQYSNTS